MWKRLGASSIHLGALGYHLGAIFYHLAQFSVTWPIAARTSPHGAIA
jgi:hypothetical protein